MNILLFFLGVLLIVVALLMIFKERISEFLSDIWRRFHRKKVKDAQELFSILINDVLDEKSVRLWEDLLKKYGKRIRRL